jgi:hypothetical protein
LIVEIEKKLKDRYSILTFFKIWISFYKSNERSKLISNGGTKILGEGDQEFFFFDE